MNSEKIRVAWLSFWGAHTVATPTRRFPGPGYAELTMAHPDVDIVTTWDEDPIRGRDLAARLGLPFVEDLDGLLTRPDVDGVIVQSATRLHREIITKAAKAGKHIMTAKVLAPTIKEAKEIVDAADAAGVVLLVQIPWISQNYILRTKEIIESGVLGTLVNVRGMHYHGMAIGTSPVDDFGILPDGFFQTKEACGGALVDMCHLTYLTPYLCGGLPTSAYAKFWSVTRRGDVEDNAVVIFDYADGPHVTMEVGWVTLAAPGLELEVNGTLGTVHFRSDNAPRGDWKNCFFVARIGDQTEFTPVDAGISGPSLLDQWIQHIRNGTRADENIALSLDLSRLNEAAYLSASHGKPVDLSRLAE